MVSKGLLSGFHSSFKFFSKFSQRYIRDCQKYQARTFLCYECNPESTQEVEGGVKVWAVEGPGIDHLDVGPAALLSAVCS